MLHQTARALAAFRLLCSSLATHALALDMRPSVSLELAKRMADACEAKAKQEGWNLNIAVVDAGGHVIALQRLDTTFAASADIAVGKARTAVLFKKPR